MKKTLLLTLNSVCILSMGNAIATPWIETDDVFLKHNLQILADAGYISTPLNTWPIMWTSITHDLADVNPENISEELQLPYSHVINASRLATEGTNNLHFKLGVSSEAPITYGFENRPRSEGGWVEGAYQYVDKNISAKVKVSYGQSENITGENNVRYDGSYFSYILGNWAVTAGFQERWWGPGNDSTLLLSDNARPLPAISLTRINTEGFETPWLSWIGDWTFTTYVGRFEDERYINDALLWGMRANFRPTTGLEIGLSRNIQLCGDNRPCDHETFSDAFVGKDNPEGEAGLLQQEPGNQLAGIDLRYSFSAFEQPFATYVEWIGEDEEGGLPNKALKMIGGEWFKVNAQRSTKVYLEFSDTETRCFDNNAGDCAYEHDIYLSGYRHYTRSLGSTYDSDTRALVMGIATQQNNGHSWHLKLKSLEINRNGTQPSQEAGGSPLSDTHVDTESISFTYKMPLYDGFLTLGGEWFSDDVRVVDQSIDTSLYATWEFSL